MVNKLEQELAYEYHICFNMMNLNEVQYIPGACQQTIIHNTLYFFILYQTF